MSARELYKLRGDVGMITKLNLLQKVLMLVFTLSLAACGGGGGGGTPQADTVPDTFSFTDQTDVALSTVITSNSITVAGIDTATAISVTDGEYAIDGGAFTSTAGTVTNGQSIAVRQTSSASFATLTDATLSIGGIADTFSVTTRVADTTPDAFGFTDQIDVALSSVIGSNSITVAGINTATAISVSGSEYAIDGGAFTSTAGTVTNGQSIAVRQTSSASFATLTDATLSIGGIADTFSVTTRGADTTPDAFSFTDQTNVTLSTVITSNSITVTGIETAAAISVSGGEYAIDGGAFTNTAGTVTNGQTVTVQHTSSSLFTTVTSTLLSIGGIDGLFSSTTGPIGTGFNQARGFDNSVLSISPATDGSDDVYVGGAFTSYNGSASNRIIRLNSDGSVDTAFNVGNGFNGVVFSLSPATDGSGDVYVGGAFTSYNGSTSIFFIRLNSDGSVDTAFNVGTGFDGFVQSISPATDGSGDVYVGGAFTSYNGSASNGIIRLNSDGTVDTAFNVGTGFNSGVQSLSTATDGSGDVYVGGLYQLQRQRQQPHHPPEQRWHGGYRV